MKEVLLCKYGEIVLKGANRSYFEDVLSRQVRQHVAPYGNFEVRHSQSTIYIEPLDEGADIDGALKSVCRVFGIVGVNRCAVAEKNMEDIRRVAAEYLPLQLAAYQTFKVEAKRSDKMFPLDSMQISADIGGVILSACPRLKVDVHHPDVTVRVEIREYGAYIHAGQMKGAGGMPLGTNGRGLLLLSGGIDSPVAGYMMAKRGVRVEAVHFESFPYTSERAKEKVLSLAGLLTPYTGEMDVHVVSLTHIQEVLVKACDEEYFTLLLRRFMMSIADRIAKKRGCQALITGESLGQVASQTMQALGVTDCMTSLPVFRPCIGMDKEEIVQIARRIDTYDTSILPYEDCCTVFTPRHPKTRPDPAKVAAQQEKVDFEALIEEALGTKFSYHVEAQY